jgi:hypothetical protein
MPMKMVRHALALSALLFIATPQSSSAEGGCPSGFVPDGNYCRNIECDANFTRFAVNQEKAKALGKYIAKYGLTCSNGWAYWGDNVFKR